jgi:hypothetical protein
MEQIAAALQEGLPAWATAFATLTLALAAAIARRIQRRGAQPQGERLGEVERLIESERTRRRQIERELYERYGVELPYWPPDGPNQPRPRWTDDDDQADDEPEAATTTVRPSIPPLPDYSHHRRETQR